MKNIFKTNQRGIIAILTLCMLLNTIGICVHATSMPKDNMATPEDTTVVVEETVVATNEPIIVTDDNVVVTEENTQELMPMMARGCENDYNHIFGNPEHNLDEFVEHYGGDQAAAYAAVSVAAQAYVTSHQITGIINAFNQITLNVSGFNITVRGNVINGRLHIGTFFII